MFPSTILTPHSRRFLLILTMSCILSSVVHGSNNDVDALCEAPTEIATLQDEYETCYQDVGSGFLANSWAARHCTNEYGDACLNLNFDTAFVTIDPSSSNFIRGVCIIDGCPEGTCQNATQSTIEYKNGTVITVTNDVVNCTGLLGIFAQTFGVVSDEDEMGCCGLKEGNDDYSCDRSCHVDSGFMRWWVKVLSGVF